MALVMFLFHKGCAGTVVLKTNVFFYQSAPQTGFARVEVSVKATQKGIFQSNVSFFYVSDGFLYVSYFPIIYVNLFVIG